MYSNDCDDASVTVSTARVCLQYIIKSCYIVSMFERVPDVYNMIHVIYIHGEEWVINE